MNRKPTKLLPLLLMTLLTVTLTACSGLGAQGTGTPTNPTQTTSFDLCTSSNPDTPRDETVCLDVELAYILATP